MIRTLVERVAGLERYVTDLNDGLYPLRKMQEALRLAEGRGTPHPDTARSAVSLRAQALAFAVQRDGTGLAYLIVEEAETFLRFLEGRPEPSGHGERG